MGLSPKGFLDGGDSDNTQKNHLFTHSLSQQPRFYDSTFKIYFHKYETYKVISYRLICIRNNLIDVLSYVHTMKYKATAQEKEKTHGLKRRDL